MHFCDYSCRICIVHIDNQYFLKSTYINFTLIYGYQLDRKKLYSIEAYLLYMGVKYYQYSIGSYLVICKCSSKIDDLLTHFARQCISHFIAA